MCLQLYLNLNQYRAKAVQSTGESTIGLTGISFGEDEIQTGVQVIEIKLFAQVLKVRLGPRMEHDPPDGFGAIIKFDFHDQQVFGSSILISGFSRLFVLV